MGISQIEETTSVHQQPVNDAESPSALTTGGRDGAAARLEEMGYKQELTRNLGMISVLGLSFAIMAVPFGTSTTLNIALTDGGPVTILYGWIFVSLVSLCMASSLAEICSVFPTSGGVYYWSAMLSTEKYSSFASYLTGWMGTVGNWTVTASITFGGSQLILAAATLFHEDYVPTAWQTCLVYWGALLVSLLCNIFFHKHLDKLNNICLWWTGASIIVTLLAKADNRNSAKFAFSHFDAQYSGWPSGWAWFVGLLQGAYTLTGYGMVASLCEEVNEPAREVPRAMVLSVAAAAVTGIVYLPLLAVASLQPMPLLYKEVTGSAGAALGLLCLILGIWVFAAIGSLTAASRCTWAFSRDGGIPASGWWKKVDQKFGIPVNSLILSTIVCALLGLIYLGSSAAFNAFTGVATICLGCSYAFPVFCSLLRRREAVRNASFSLGKFGYVINIITVVWISFSIILFCMPTAIPVTAGSMNYASVVFAGFSFIAALWYVVNARKHYHGPTLSTVRVGDSAEIVEEYSSSEKA
ncbi:GabA permease [Cryptococcus deuterogattii LA55]|nr:GabA permease [Cryptococcus deuterogattii LA55]KIR36516.1 GabA permease [Cryptococcus deuterogattii MMRL2647]KIR75946.1 GabA permease [Cryptococcus deuterogattii CA1014]KIR95889.1 GabA permease [Cryptococcus deuterogattii CBS 10090]KIS02385.1 GabA permease [Cryptococcus deuterogattii 2001/935-1]